jgi:hypothetical protein
MTCNGVDLLKTIREFKMGNECGNVREIETTVIRCETSLSAVRIYCDPMTRTDFFILWRNDPNFITLYNRLKLTETFRIKFRRHGSTAKMVCFGDPKMYEITDIGPPIARNFLTKVTGFLNIPLEFPQLQDYEEVMVNPCLNLQGRLLIKKSEKHDMIIGQAYNISYIKFHGKNLYHIESYEPVHKLSL